MTNSDQIDDSARHSVGERLGLHSECDPPLSWQDLGPVLDSIGRHLRDAGWTWCRADGQPMTPDDWRAGVVPVFMTSSNATLLFADDVERAGWFAVVARKDVRTADWAVVSARKRRGIDLQAVVAEQRERLIAAQAKIEQLTEIIAALEAATPR